MYGCIYTLHTCGYLQCWYEITTESTCGIDLVKGGDGGKLERHTPGQGDQGEEPD